MLRRHTYDRSHPVRWIWSHARRHWWIIIMMVIGAAGNAGLAAVVPVLTGIFALGAAVFLFLGR